MTDIALPYGLKPQKVTWTLDRNVALAESPFSRAAQRQARSGDRWRATVSWPTFERAKAHALATWLDLVSRGDNVALLEAYQNDVRDTESGGANFADLNGPWAVTQLSGWVSQNLVTPAFVDSSGYAIGHGSGTAPALFKKGFATVTGVGYSFVVDIPVAAGNTLVVLEDSGGPISSVVVGPGRVLIPFYARQALTQVTLYCRTSTDIFQKALYGDAQIYRRYSGQGAFPAGSSQINLQGGSVSTPNRALRAGQFITVVTSSGAELKRVQRDVHMLAGGTLNGVSVAHLGLTFIEPALRGSLADQAPIYHLKPWCRMRLATPESVSDIGPPLLHGFSAEFVEEI